MEPDQPERKKFTIADLPPRPKPVNGDFGHAMRFVSNYYRILFKEKDPVFYQYEATFNPEVPQDARKTIRSIFDAIKKELEDKVGPTVYRGTMLWSFRTPKQNLSFKCTANDEEGASHEYVVSLKKTTEFPLNKLEAGGKDSQQVIQVLNSILKKKMAEIGMVEIGRNSKFYDKKAINDGQVEGSDLKVWRGFTTSIQIVTGKAFLMVDFSTRVMRRDNLLITMSRMSKDEKRDLVGQTVLAPYGNYKTYKIEGFNYDKNPSSTFRKKDNTQISFKDYYKKAYGVTIKEPDQPLIVSSVKRKIEVKGNKLEEIVQEINLLPELVYLTGMSDEERNNRNLMKALAQYTKLEPHIRLDCNLELLQKKAITSNEIFDVENQETEMEGTILHPPTILLKDREEHPRDGQVNIRSKILNPSVLKDWLIVYTDNGDRDRNECDDFLRTLIEAGKTFGIQVEKPAFYYADGSLNSFLDKIENDVKKNGKPKVVVTFLRQNESKFYTDLKQLLYLKLGVPHQNVLRKSLNKNAMSVCSKIILQINAKLGDPVWQVSRSLKETRDRKIAIGGIAIYHKLINKGKESCAAFVGTINNNFTQYFSRAKLMPVNTQSINSLEDIMTKWIQTYFKKNTSLPDTLIVYRDGVGEGQIVKILDMELPSLQKAIETAAKKVRPGYSPEVIFLLANKKVPQRMFENPGAYGRGRGGKGGSKISNPPPGSIVAGPMSRYNFDFFMVPQWVNQGTATPTHYVVVHNKSKLSAEALYTLTYEQCYNYYNWTGAVRIPASLMYANKLATMVGEYLKATPTDDQLSSMLYSL